MLLREATEGDIPLIVETEWNPEFRAFIGQWTREEHTSAMRDPDTRYFIIVDDSAEPMGYAILRGLRSGHCNIELKRIAMRSPGQGNGRQALRLLLKKVFDEFGAHRLWLDVFETNLRAQHIYRGFGFRQEGVLREAVCRDGEYHSLFLMSLLDREYRETNPG
jgi:RimJ/RimL family protein N-acetyltransferase